MSERSNKWFFELLVCLECQADDLVEEGGVLRCRSCSTVYPVCHTVPMLLKRESFVDAAQSIAAHLGGISAEDVQSVFGTALRYRLSDVTLRTEFTNIVERYADVLPQKAVRNRPDTSEPFTLIAHYFNDKFVAGQTCYRSFRLRNNSKTVWSSAGEKPWNLSYFLYDLNDPEVKIEGVRSAFPVPLRPDHELTIPLRIAVPSKTGRYRITVKLVQEFVGWINQSVYENEIDVSANAVDRPSLTYNPHAGFFDFSEDLQQCGKVLRRAIGMLRDEGLKQSIRILEVACGNDPQTLRHYQPDTFVVACDVAFPQVQFGALQYAAAETPNQRGSYRFVAADVYNPPFRSGGFDMVVISAALHHFVDLTDALIRLSSLLQPQGLLVLMREPCKVFPEDETFIKELLNGFNEQQFELEEYDEMFQQASLVRGYEQIDYECSYKVILRKQSTKIPC